ncbi:MAG: hypothetical protein FWG11_08680 [Promicromonosporaceae bacterium]|nr:hypothetical protein [Promicromonosporaceae bacterium]
MRDLATDTSGYADAREVAEFAAGLSESFLLCRELQHNWKPWTAQRDNEHNNYVRIIRCQRCKTAKHQRLSFTGTILSSHYDYPEGYVHANLGRIVGDGRDVLRLESLARLLGADVLKAG